MFPIEDPRIKARIVDDIMGTEMRDNTKSRELRPDGTYERLKSDGHEPVRAQSVFFERAREIAARADAKARYERPFIVRPVRNRPTKAPDGIELEVDVQARESVLPDSVIGVPGGGTSGLGGV
jgi:polyphosphate kinase